MGSPSIFVYDCNNAGLIVQSFIQFAAQREQEQEVNKQNLYVHGQQTVILPSLTPLLHNVTIVWATHKPCIFNLKQFFPDLCRFSDIFGQRNCIAVNLSAK